MSAPTAVDVMGFAGGMTLGIVQAGFDLIAKREMDGGFGVPNCEANRHLLGDRWQTQVSAAEAWEPVSADLVFGNPPCSGFSVMSPNAFRGVDSKINHCMWAFSSYVARCQPTIAIMESVRSAYSSGHELMTALRANVEGQTGLRYNLYHVYQNAMDLGGAARRPRYFMVLSQVPFGVEYPSLTRLATARAVLEDLDTLALTWRHQPYRKPATWWSSHTRSEHGVVDGHMPHDSAYIRRGLELYRANGGWPAGVSIGEMARRYYEQHQTLPGSWAVNVDKLIAKKFHMGFPTTTMLRWRADEPCRVITGSALEQVIHPWLPRMMTHREVARVMGFPDDWQISTISTAGTGALPPTWGKGVTVHCGRWIGNWARRALAGEPGALTGEPVGEREWFIDQPKANKLTPPRVRDEELELTA
jgi:DNA (cytosine-5)-methyltransferase 1